MPSRFIVNPVEKIIFAYKPSISFHVNMVLLIIQNNTNHARLKLKTASIAYDEWSSAFAETWVLATKIGQMLFDNILLLI